MIDIDTTESLPSSLIPRTPVLPRPVKTLTADVLVENLTEDKSKVFGRTEYMTSVIFNGKREHIGKIVKVKITNSNRTTLFGELLSNPDQKVA